jgi:hypothetical protein
MVTSMPSPPPTSWQRRVAPVAHRQRSLVTARQLDRVALSATGRRWAVETGRLIRIRYGVFILPGVKPTWETHVMAALLAAGDPVVASSLTAARLWQLFDGNEPAGAMARIHVTASGDHHLEGVTVHRQRLRPDERCTRDGIPVTTVARTLFDLASVVDADVLGDCIDEALRRKILMPSYLVKVLERNAGSGRRRLVPLRNVLAERLPDYNPGANKWELHMDQQWDSLGLPAAVRQHWVVAESNAYCLDRALAELRLAVEWVGTDHHDKHGRYHRDRRRTSDLVLAGWDLIEVTPDWSPERIRRTVLAKVAERRRLLAVG